MTDLTAQVLSLVLRVLPSGVTVTSDSELKQAGLSSLSATRLWFELRNAFGVDIPVTQLVQYRTIRDLAAAVAQGMAARPTGTAREDQETHEGQEAQTAAPSSGPAGAADPFPLTELQQSYLVGKDPHLSDDPVGCHVYREFEVTELDRDRLRVAWQRVVARHGMLRAVITSDGRQRILAEVPAVPFTVHDLTARPPAEFAAHLAAARERLSHRCYTPADSPLWTVEVSCGPGGRGVVHLSIDVIFIDGHGLAVLLDDWWRWYEDPDRTDTGSRVTIQECLASLAAERRAPEYGAHLSYWASRLAGVPDGPDLGAAAKPGPTTDPALGCLRRTALTAVVSRRQWAAVSELADGWGASPTALVLTLFAETLTAHGTARPCSLVLTASHRGRLPAAAETEIGPFTSSIVFPVPDTVRLALPDAVRRTHQQLWADLEHAAVGGVTALRRLRQADRSAPPPRLPVVFTSMLGVGGPAAESGFARAVTYATSQTTGVALDHQMWELDGELHIRWDVLEEEFPHGAVRTAFCRFLNLLEGLTAAPPVTRDLNELQQAYFVPRSAAALADPAPAGSAAPPESPGRAPAWDGCQVYHSFDVDDLDVTRLERAWLRLAGAHDVLRSLVSHDGKVQVSPAAPDRWHIPVIDLSVLDDPDAYLAGMRDTMAGRALPLGRAPQYDIRVTVGRGAPTVHLLTDLTMLDGRSIHLLVRELFRLYADPDAASLPGAGYDAFRRELRVTRDQPGYQALAGHWRQRVAALPPGPRLRAGERRDAPTGDGGERGHVRHESEVHGWRAVRRAALAARITPDDLLAAALSQVLARHYGVPFALPVVRWTDATMRYRPGEFTALSWVTRDDSVTGIWEQAAVFRRALDEDAAADGVSGLVELRKRVLRERRTGDFALPVVYTGLYDLAGQPLPPGVRLGPWLTCTPDVSLDCIAIEEGDELRLYWDVVPAHFEPGVLPAMFAEYAGLVRGLTDSPCELAAPPSSADRQTMLGAWNDTAFPFDDPGPAHLRFEEQARRQPDAIALRWTGGTMTYGDLNRQANRVAHTLRAAGFAAGTPVAVSVPRGPLMAVAVYGVLKAGCFYVPVEPSLPAERSTAILRDAQIPVVLTSSGRRGWAVPDDIQAILLDALPADADHETPPAVTDSSALAYVIFTSGSTGKPKGVAVQHRPLHNLFNWCYRTHGFGPSDVGLCVTSLGFDLSVFDLLGLLGCGAGLYIASETEQKDPELLLDILLREPITFWNSAPAALNQIAPLFRGRAGRSGTDILRLVYLSGDYTPLPLPGEVRALFPQARIVSLGGATEATVWSNWFEVDAIDPDWRSIPYGRPIDNARYYIVDERMEPCPVGVEGDLLIGGTVLSAGYYREPELTAERFIADPFGPEPRGRLYRTGDRASFFPDGNICFLGRADGQVKIRGFRVELGDIEHRIRAHAGVKDAVVLGRRDRSGDQKLVAYVVRADGHPAPGVAELRQHTATGLPDYMVPNVVCFVDTFPATDNGKLDREALPWPAEPGSYHVLSAALPAPAASADGASPDLAVPPGNGPAPTAGQLAAEIAEIFRDLLGVTEIGLDDDLWDQGATSYTMVQVSAALRDRHGRSVPVSALLAEPTVAGIAREIAPVPAADGARSAHDGATEAEGGTVPAHGTAPAGPAPALTGVAAVPDGAAATVPAATVPAPSVPAQVDFFSAAERSAFKRARHDLRRPRPGEAIMPLSGRPVPEEHFRWRATTREFGTGPVPAADFELFLELLRESEIDGRKRRLYPSAGDTYGVQPYLHIRPGGVHGVAGGLYYYHPVEHSLHLIDPEPRLDRAVHFVYNRPVFDAAAFELYLFGQADAIVPVYGEQSDRFLALEAGALGQLLMLSQATCGLGLCPIGSVAEDPLREQFKLTDSHRYLMAFLAGPVTRTGLSAHDGSGPLFASTTPHPAPGPRSGPAAAPDPEVAVTGMAARLPGADNLELFWQQLSHGSTGIGPVPADRHGELGYTRVNGGFLDDIDLFDSLFFHVSPREAASLDPQLRLLMQVVWESLEVSGHTPESLTATAGRVGVFVGAMWHDFQQVGADDWRSCGQAAISATASDTANRISHFLGFTGPSVAVDASCSSSLAALHMAAESIRSGDCGAAVVAAVNLFAHPYHLNLLADLGLLATAVPGGAFDSELPGWTPGEGAAAILLRPADAARQDGDQVFGIVESTRIGHTGGRGRFGTPDAAALGESVAATIAAARITPDQIGYVECAAAGAALADAAEIEALAGAFADRSTPVLIGTVKPNTGHLEAAAGLCQVLKVLLQFRNRQIAPTLASDHASPLVSLAAGPLRLARQLSHWRAEGAGALRALVNAVGAGGSCGHVVLREPRPLAVAAPALPGGNQVVLVSAETPQQLTAAAGLLRDRLAGPRRQLLPRRRPEDAPRHQRTAQMATAARR